MEAEAIFENHLEAEALVKKKLEAEVILKKLKLQYPTVTARLHAEIA